MELVDSGDLKSLAVRRAGSNPALGTILWRVRKIGIPTVLKTAGRKTIHVRIVYPPILSHPPPHTERSPPMAYQLIVRYQLDSPMDDIEARQMAQEILRLGGLNPLKPESVKLQRLLDGAPPLGVILNI
jgi:hypothetical protein